jgi:hypothetical protein
MPSPARSRRPCACSCRADAGTARSNSRGHSRSRDRRACAFNLLRVAAEMQRGQSQRNFRRARSASALIVDQHLVPINLQIRHERIFRAPAGSLPSGRPQWCAPGPPETHIVRDALPFAIRQLRFDVRRDGLHARLPRGIERSRAEVIHIAGHQQPQRGLSRHGPRSSVSACRLAKPS